MQHMMNRFRPFDARDYSTPNDGWAGFSSRAPRTHRATWRSLRQQSAERRSRASIDNDALGGLADVQRIHSRNS